MGIIFCHNGFSQTTQQKVEKQLQNSQRKANAGKADVISTNKKSIFDSSAFNNNSAEAINNKTAKSNDKKTNCRKKAKQRSAGFTVRRKA